MWNYLFQQTRNSGLMNVQSATNVNTITVWWNFQKCVDWVHPHNHSNEIDWILDKSMSNSWNTQSWNDKKKKHDSFGLFFCQVSIEWDTKIFLWRRQKRVNRFEGRYSFVCERLSGYQKNRTLQSASAFAWSKTATQKSKECFVCPLRIIMFTFSERNYSWRSSNAHSLLVKSWAYQKL